MKASHTGGADDRRSIGREIREFWSTFCNHLINNQLQQKRIFLERKIKVSAEKSIGFVLQKHRF